MHLTTAPSPWSTGALDSVHDAWQDCCTAPPHLPHPRAKGVRTVSAQSSGNSFNRLLVLVRVARLSLVLAGYKLYSCCFIVSMRLKGILCEYILQITCKDHSNV